MTDTVKTERRGHALIIWNCNAAMRNALTPAYYSGVIAGVQQAAADDGVAAIVLAGEGDFFCAGGDLNALQERRALTYEQRQDKIDKLGDVIRSLRTSPKPVVAAVEGGAAGAGVSIAMACDMIVAAEQAKFTLAYIRAGLVPDGAVTYALSRALPRATLARMAMMAEPLGASRLLDLGVITETTPAGEALARACALADRLYQFPPQALAEIKLLMNAAESSDFESHLTRERDAMAQALGGDEALTGITAFLNKKAPIFREGD
ncbi:MULTISPECIES: enoyl-CoA hydratase family protein [unclassified Ruegeria]|uniref:oxepin-CoA hydrolase, alternative type n=1 Tax=unclassified Ruegeria TaxID=2625375 RepID=UPI001ADABC66|nr:MULTISPECIES: enoyl-CoA hydratase family protein [unclassified Ruegeria]MBO9413567.1 enoyl-CoA hydratase/isomerase family protein [Ruegeria sp. R8_1]MBO9417250.1 enoyl-CoA hydratase/isomerase family protein [Ruegeria sp. R8_2]